MSWLGVTWLSELTEPFAYAVGWTTRPPSDVLKQLVKNNARHFSIPNPQIEFTLLASGHEDTPGVHLVIVTAGAA